MSEIMGMLKLDMSKDEFVKIYQINPEPRKCLNCGELQNFTIPVKTKSIKAKFAGLLSDHDKCGDEFRQLVCVSLNQKINQSMRELFGHVSGKKVEQLQ